jgi:hypothetical protein
MSEPSSTPNIRKPTRKPLRFEDFKKLMTKEQMEAFAAACRIKYGTAEAEDYVTVAKHERMLSAKRGDDGP